MGRGFIILCILIIVGCLVTHVQVFPIILNQNAESQADLVLIEILWARSNGSGVIFTVDTTVSYLVLDIQSVTQSQNCTTFGPNGHIYFLKDDNESSDVKKQVHVTSPRSGLWSLECTEDPTYRVLVWGVSDVTFQLHFLDLSDNPINGDPIQDTNVTIGIEVSGMEYLESVSSVEIISQTGQSDIFPVRKEGFGRHHNFYRQIITVPHHAFRVGFTAMDTKNITVRRQSSAVIQPKTFTVTISQITKDSSPGSDVIFSYSIYNRAKRNQTFGVQVLLNTLRPDDFLSNVTAPSTVSILPLTEFTTAFYVTISYNSSVGSSCDVTLSIEGANQNVEFAKISLIVQPTKLQPSIRPAIMTSSEDVSKRSTPTPRTTQTVTQLSTLHADDMSSVSDVTSMSSNTHVVQTTEVPSTSMGAQKTSKSTSLIDVSPPAFSKVSFIDRCDQRVGCSLRVWVVVFVVQDNESGVHRVTVEDSSLSSVQTEHFTDGLANVPIHGNISTSCCQNETVLIVEDMVGNKGRYHVTYEHHKNATNGTSTISEDSRRQELRDLAAIVVGICASILVLIIILTAIIQFQSKITSFLGGLKLKRPEKEVELRVPHKLSIKPERTTEQAESAGS
uniref:Uncharacterized protein LOC111121299 n=1 Tax=Crassostrea virginica TaxID=6565 RepID=A0A8B8CUU3_CRAVI|nr:uncharacterized protein LOC111121299 [Crassostrea virginica]